MNGFRMDLYKAKKAKKLLGGATFIAPVKLHYSSKALINLSLNYPIYQFHKKLTLKGDMVF